ncbi:HalOD1 output domain-containing protein [Haloprofundus salilacus]|uniref:HalOD1 output domain-containing protein n=1 Tax=Haloprofundus salilacus TaxID=2876190 RepID=UPI001CC9847C|nr:HalOD1 output domain-containing protein [Haloprofundus salilacus]
MPGQFDRDEPRDISYDPEREQYSVKFSRTRDAPSIELIVAIAEIEGRDTDDIEPLYEAIDPDALDAIFQQDSETTAERNGRLSFVFNGRDVTVWSDGRIDISLSDTERERAASEREDEGTTARGCDELGRDGNDETDSDGNDADTRPDRANAETTEANDDPSER